jgi:outer membrane autotransporter protein
MPAALNALSPQGYQVWSDIAFAHTASLADRLGQQSFTTPGDDDLYFEVAQSRGYLHGDRDVDSARYTSESGLVGINHGVNENLTVGAFFEYTESRSGLGSSGSDTEVKDKMPGVRAAWKRDGWFGTATAAYGFDDYESTRAINFAGTSEKAKSKTKGSQWLLDVTAGHRFQAGLVSLSPFAGLQASGWKADGFTETGAGAFNATVADQSARSLRTQLGLEAAVNFAVGSAVVSPHVRAAWVHELSNDARSMDASFGAVDYAVETRDPQRDSARLSAGLDVAFSPAVGLYADYTIQTGDRSRVIGEWSAGVSVRF